MKPQSLFPLLLLAATLETGPAADAPAILHRRGENQCHTFRIPGLNRTPRGTLLAVYDMRYDGTRDLQGNMDIGLSRSTDGGLTWSVPRPIMDMGEYGGLPQSENGCSDPNILIDRATGEIMVSALWSHGKPGQHQWRGKGSEPGFEIGVTAQFMMVRSTDDGLTWTPPENLTRQLKQEPWYLFAPAPGNGLTMEDGTLVMPTQGRDEEGLPFSNLIWSPDHGKSWTVSAPARHDTTESTVAELGGGTLMLNMRDNRNGMDKSPTNGRAVSVTKDRGKSWTVHPSDHGALPEPVCMGSLLSHRIRDGRRVLFFSNPRDKTKRKEITLQASLDDGTTWPEAHRVLIDPDPSAGYSCLAIIDADTLGILYESSEADLAFRRVPLAGFHLDAAAPAPEPSRLAVIAPARFHPALDPYVKHRGAAQSVDLVSLESVLAGTPGTDDAEKVKRFLFDAWRSRSTGYALLVGDADVFPVRYMVLDRATPAAFDYAFYPSDLYYADLARRDGSFDDWNGRHDDFHAGYFGEVRGEKNKGDPMNFDGIDYRPELAVGRWPVNTIEEVERVVAKTIRYGEALAAGTKPGASTAVFAAVGGWVDSRALLSRFAEKLASAWKVEKRFYHDARQIDGPPGPTEPEIVSLLNVGTGLVCHAGHGQDDLWEQSLSVRSLARLTNADRLPVVISIGCSTARFATLPPYEPYVDAAGTSHRGTNAGEIFTAPPPPPACYQSGPHNPTGLGEQLLRASEHGAVAYIGCNTGSQPCALTLLDGFTSALGAAPAPRLGDAWSAAVTHYFDHENLATLQPTDSWYPASIFFQAMKFMLFGDPSLPLPGTVASQGHGR